MKYSRPLSRLSLLHAMIEEDDTWCYFDYPTLVAMASLDRSAHRKLDATLIHVKRYRATIQKGGRGVFFDADLATRLLSARLLADPHRALADRCLAGDVDVVLSLLLAKRCAPSADALFAAVEGSSERCVRALVDAGAAIDASDGHGNTALMLSAKNGHDHVARNLLEAGAAVDATDEADWTSLMYAAQNGHEGCAR